MGLFGVIVLAGHARHSGQVGGHGIGVDGPAQGESLGQGSERDGEAPGGEQGRNRRPSRETTCSYRGGEVVLECLVHPAEQAGDRLLVVLGP
jgi:hypothetical protein